MLCMANQIARVRRSKKNAGVDRAVHVASRLKAVVSRTSARFSGPDAAPFVEYEPARSERSARGKKGGDRGSQRYGAAHFARIGALGGTACWKGVSKTKRTEHARKAALARWRGAEGQAVQLKRAVRRGLTKGPRRAAPH